MASPLEFESIDDPEIIAIGQAFQQLAHACLDSTVSRQALQSQCVQVFADAINLLVRLEERRRASEKEVAQLKEALNAARSRTAAG